MRPLVVAILAALFCAPALSRGPGGQLDALLTPNEGAPAVSAPGLGFVVRATERGQVTLRRDDALLPIKSVWDEVPGGYIGWAEVPESAAPGWFDIALDEDRTSHAVYLRKSFPPAYAFAAVAGDLEAVRAFLEETDGNGAQRPAFAALFATGPADSLPTPGQLRAIETPVVLIPSAAALAGGRYETLYGPPTRVFPFGPDGYLCFDASEFVYGQSTGPTAGALQRLRRDIKPARWSIGFGAAYGAAMHPRLPLTLFLDDPLDLCLFGRALGGGPAGAAHAPFDTTTVAALPERGGMLILVDAGGLEVAPAPAEPTPPHEEESP